MGFFRKTLIYGGGLGSACAAGGYAALHYNHQQGMIGHANYSYAPPPKREDNIERMKKEHFDLIVIGGGATGSGVAVDGASRGLNCALVEYDDFASGTSSRSTKLLHGGVRYLEAAFKNLDIGQLYLVWEALEERAHMMKSAPFMSKPLPIVMPIYNWWQVPYFYAGIKAYDWLAKLVCCFDTGLPECFYTSRANTLFLFPLLKSEGLKGALVYYDGQHNDSRMNIQLALTASMDGYVEGMKGAAVANHCQVIGVIKDSDGLVNGIKVRDTVKKEEFDIHGKVVVNCTGPFADQIREMADPNCRKLVAPAAGVHVVLPKWYSPPNFGMIIPETTDGRVLFYLPWEDNTIAGTTDAKSVLTHLPKPTSEEVDFIVRESARYLSLDEAQIRQDIKASWSGLRPLVKDPKSADEGSTAKLSRSHEIVVDPSGLVSVMGGKWTTYRRMAQDAVDKILEVHRDKIRTRAPCRTKNLLIMGSHDHTGNFQPKEVSVLGGKLPLHLTKQYNLKLPTAEYLVRSYGFRALDVCELGKKEGLLDPLVPNQPFIRAEVVYAVRHEMGCTIPDVLGRRIRLAFVDADEASRIAHDTVRLMARELKWHFSQISEAEKEAKAFLHTMTYKNPAE